MSLSEKVNVIIYRFQKKGLEIFVVNDEEKKWNFPKSEEIIKKIASTVLSEEEIIELDPVEKIDGKVEQGLAVEGDWHDIPSLKSLFFKDALYVKDKIKEIIPELQNGNFMPVKEAVKVMLSHQIEMLKELKDILTDRNSTKDI